MNIQKLDDRQITMLEIFLNSYRHFRKSKVDAAGNSRSTKRITCEVRRFNSWMSNDLGLDDINFLSHFGFLDVMLEVKIRLQTLKNLP
jgi:hypothetical protein